MDQQVELPENAIGFAKDMTPEELAGKHVDGLTGAVFETEEAYLNHVSPVTGHTPQEPEHLGPEFVAVQKAALERGKERAETPKQEAKQDEAIAALGDVPSDVK